MRALPFLLILALFGCDASVETRPAAAVYVGNRGGTVTRIDPATGANAEAFGFDAPVRSVVESGRRLYVLTSGAEADSGRVVEIDLDAGARVRETGVLRPRRIAIADGVGYVTNERTFSVTPVRLATGRTEPRVVVGDAPEGVAVVDGRVYVASWFGGFSRDVRIVSALTQTVASADDILLDVCDGPRDLLVDTEGEVWVFCTGRPATAEAPATNGAVVVLDGRAVVARFDLGTPLGTPGGHDAAFRSATSEVVVAVGTALVRFDTRANARGETVEIAGAAASPISAVAVDEASGEIYLGRLAASDPFGAPGFVSVHARDGAELQRFAAGVFPVAVVFERR